MPWQRPQYHPCLPEDAVQQQVCFWELYPQQRKPHRVTFTLFFPRPRYTPQPGNVAGIKEVEYRSALHHGTTLLATAPRQMKLEQKRRWSANNTCKDACHFKAGSRCSEISHETNPQRSVSLSVKVVADSKGGQGAKTTSGRRSCQPFSRSAFRRRVLF